MFMLLTESSFTENDLHLLMDALSYYANIDFVGKSTYLREKINNMIFTGNYLPDDKSKIINK